MSLEAIFGAVIVPVAIIIVVVIIVVAVNKRMP